MVSVLVRSEWKLEKNMQQVKYLIFKQESCIFYMQHSFTTRRDDVRELRQLICMCKDVETVCRMPTEDYHKMLKRREVDIVHAPVRETLDRLSIRLGVLIDEITILGKHHQLPCKKVATLAPSWNSYITGTLKSGTDVFAAINILRGHADAKLVDLEIYEAESGSSTYSDYSNSSTDSDDDDTKRSRYLKETDPMQCERETRQRGRVNDKHRQGDDEEGESDESSSSHSTSAKKKKACISFRRR